MTYLVEIKPTARKRHPEAGTTVHEMGHRQVFESRDQADRWATELADDGPTVWIQDAPPQDRSPVDGYLMARRPPRSTQAPFESEQETLATAGNGD